MGSEGTSKKQKWIAALSLAVYAALVIVYAVVKRGTALYSPHFRLFWSYGEWLRGDRSLGWEILANIALFFPVGYLLAALTPGKRSLLITAAAALLFSCCIEAGQWLSMRGMPETDDLMNNTLGAVIGWAFCQVTRKRFLPFFCACAVAVMAFFCLTGKPAPSKYPTLLCFQAKDAGDGKIEGFAFQYEMNTPRRCSLLLRSVETGKTTALALEGGLERNDVNDYFACGYDYRLSGFRARAAVEEECEFIVQFSPFLQVPTGVYLSPASGIHYAPEASFRAPDTGGSEALERIVKSGVLRLYRPREHCWIYQYGGALYWIAGEGFLFEDDGTTLIQYHLHTTQTDRLPPERLENDWLWDNRSSYFEKYELEGDFGSYRVMKRELPTDYAITSITTGYYKNGKWIWQDFFRPYYALDAEEKQEEP